MTEKFVRRSRFVLLQFLIVKEQAKVQLPEDDPDDPVVDKTWEFIKEHWNLDKPKLIISVIYDYENSFMNQRLLKSILHDLVKAAAPVKGK